MKFYTVCLTIFIIHANMIFANISWKKLLNFLANFLLQILQFFAFLLVSIHIMYLFTIQLARIIFVNDYVKIGNIEVFKNFLRISLKIHFLKNFLKQVQISIV